MSFKKNLAWLFAACAVGFSAPFEAAAHESKISHYNAKTEEFSNINASAVAHLLASGKPLSDDDILNLQRHLKSLGFYHAGFSPHFGPKTSKAVASFIQKHPESVNKLNPHTLRPLITYGYFNTLKHAVEQNPVSFAKTLQTQIINMGSSTKKIRNTSHHQQYYLQSLLAIAGYNDKANIDGKWGTRTQKAIYQFQIDNGLIPTVSNPDANIKKDREDMIVIGGPYPAAGDNGYGVSNAAIERAWARITGETMPARVFDSNDKRPLIVLDLGHNSIDSATVHSIGAKSPYEYVNGKRLSEDYLASRIAPDLARELYSMGYRVALTRALDKPIRIGHNYGLSLSARPEFAHNLASELGSKNVTFISIHANATGLKVNTAHRGADVYVRSGRNAKNLAKEITKTYRLEDNEATGVRYGNFSVLRNFEQDYRYDAKDTAVLIELGFLDHRKDAAILKEIATNKHVRHEMVLELLSAIDKHQNNIGLPPKARTNKVANKPSPPNPDLG